MAAVWFGCSDGKPADGGPTNPVDAGPTAPPVITDLAAGGYNSCIHTSHGAVKCWTLPSAPQEIPLPAPAVHIMASQLSCAGLSDGSTWCWQLAQPLAPFEVGAFRDAVQIVAGIDFYCARIERGEVRCFGHNAFGQAGTGTLGLESIPPGDSLQPVDVERVEALAAGAYYACGVRGSGGGVYCWGMAAFPSTVHPTPCGDYDCHLRPVPTWAFDGEKPWALGAWGGCEVRDGGLYCLGANHPESLSHLLDPPAPELVRGLPPTVAVYAGYSGTCAVATDGAVHCWPEQGNRPRTPRLEPELRGAHAIRMGIGHTCALLTERRVVCTRQDGTTEGRFVEIMGLVPAAPPEDAGTNPSTTPDASTPPDAGTSGGMTDSVIAGSQCTIDCFAPDGNTLGFCLGSAATGGGMGFAEFHSGGYCIYPCGANGSCEPGAVCVTDTSGSCFRDCSSCFRGCSEDSHCRPGYVCDTKTTFIASSDGTRFCVPGNRSAQPGDPCSSSADCAPGHQCRENSLTGVRQCMRDCEPTQGCACVPTLFGGRGYCTVTCTADSECQVPGTICERESYPFATCIPGSRD